MNGLPSLWQLPTDLELWLILAYLAGVLIGARVIEVIASAHYVRARRYAERGFEYIAPRDEYHCLGGATLTLHTIRETQRMAIYRAPVEHCGGCRLKAQCAPLEESRRIFRSLAIWAETDVGRFHQFFSLLMFVSAAILSVAALWQWRAATGTGYLGLAFVGSVASVVLQTLRFKKSNKD